MSAYSRFPNLAVLALAALTSVIALPHLHAQAPRPSDEQSKGDDRSPTDDGQDPAATLTADQLFQIEEWIEQLGSTEFATRERASVHLMETGAAVLPTLRRAAEETTDAETRLRAEQIIKQMTDGDLQARINQFLAGKEVDFDGWTVARASLGDSIPMRELFVQMMRLHPDLLKSLDLETRDRSLALDNLLTRIQNKLRSIVAGPEPADVFAMLLISNDANVTLDTLYDAVLLDLMRRQAGSMIGRDAHLSGPCHALLNNWIVRCGTVNREDALVQGMSLDLPATLPLALRTLDEMNSTEMVASCFQAIAKFGDRRQNDILKRYLDDARPVSDRGFVDNQSQPQIRDLAMLSLAMINGVPLDEIGMSHVQTHPAAGFRLPDLAYESDPEQSRQRARARIDQLLQQQAGSQ